MARKSVLEICSRLTFIFHLSSFIFHLLDAEIFPFFFLFDISLLLSIFLLVVVSGACHETSNLVAINLDIGRTAGFTLTSLYFPRPTTSIYFGHFLALKKTINCIAVLHRTFEKGSSHFRRQLKQIMFEFQTPSAGTPCLAKDCTGCCPSFFSPL